MRKVNARKFKIDVKGHCSKFNRVLSPNVSASPPPPPQSFTEKNSQLFQMKIFFDDDFKESVKVTNLQKCDFSQSRTLYFQNFQGEHVPGPPRRPKKFFSCRRVAQKFFSGSTSPLQNKKSYIEPCLKLQLHDAIYRLRFLFKLVKIHILSLSNLHNNVASLRKNRDDKSHRVIVA